MVVRLTQLLTGLKKKLKLSLTIKIIKPMKAIRIDGIFGIIKIITIISSYSWPTLLQLFWGFD